MNNGEKVYFNNAEHFCSSNFAELYKDNDLTIKQYTEEKASYDFRIKKEVFNIIKDVDVNALLHLRNCYSDLVKLYENPDYNEVCVTGYTYDYIPEVKEDMIDMPMEYTLNTIHEFDLLVKELNKRGIRLDDPKPFNSIKHKDNLVIIAPDLFYINQPVDMLERNYTIANLYIMKKWLKEYPLIEQYERNTLYRLIFKDYDNDFNNDYYGSMKKRLKGRTPNDVLYRIFGEKV
jgi:hypothetical protein